MNKNTQLAWALPPALADIIKCFLYSFHQRKLFYHPLFLASVDLCRQPQCLTLLIWAWWGISLPHFIPLLTFFKSSKTVSWDISTNVNVFEMHTEKNSWGVRVELKYFKHLWACQLDSDIAIIALWKTLRNHVVIYFMN